MGNEKKWLTIDVPKRIKNEVRARLYAMNVARRAGVDKKMVVSVNVFLMSAGHYKVDIQYTSKETK